jgi:hypothetical protein
MKWLGDDPALGKLLSGKSLGARKKMYLSFGVGMAFDPNSDTEYIDRSLYDGYPREPKKLAVMFNDSRLGSYSRGAETQKGGVVAKVTLRATNDIKVQQTDCNTNLYLEQPITEDNYKNFINRFMFDDKGNTVLITAENIKPLIGKTIKLRSPQYCKLEHHFCVKCMTNALDKKENAIALMVADVAGALLNSSLKKMHKSGSVETMEVDIINNLM